MSNKNLITFFKEKLIVDDKIIMVYGADSESEYKIGNTIGIRISQFKYFRDRFDKKKNIPLYNIQKDPFEGSNISETNENTVDHMELEIIKINHSSDFSFKKNQSIIR